MAVIRFNLLDTIRYCLLGFWVIDGPQKTTSMCVLYKINIIISICDYIVPVVTFISEAEHQFHWHMSNDLFWYVLANGNKQADKLSIDKEAW